MSDFTLIVVAVVAVMVLFASQQFRQAKARASKRELWLRVNGLSRAQVLPFGDSALVIDEKKAEVVLLEKRQSAIAPTRYPFRSVLSAEVVEDGDVITTSSTGSMVGRALVGGALLGPVGAVLGGATGKKNSTQKVRKVQLRVRFDDLRRPHVVVDFLSLEALRSSAIYSAAAAEAARWESVFEVVAARGAEARANGLASPEPLPVQLEHRA